MLVPYLRLTHEAGQCHGDWDSTQLLHRQPRQAGNARHQAGSEQLLLLLLLLLVLQQLQLRGGVHHGLLVSHHAGRVGHHHQTGAGRHHGSSNTGRGSTGSRGRLVLRHGGSHLLLQANTQSATQLSAVEPRLIQPRSERKFETSALLSEHPKPHLGPRVEESDQSVLTSEMSSGGWMILLELPVLAISWGFFSGSDSEL